MLAIVSLLWDSNRHSESFSQAYDESWVEKLYHGFERNLTDEFEFILYTDRTREFSVPVTQVMLPNVAPNYGHCILPYRLGRPMILVGLDTIVTGNIDHLAEYCLTAERFACPRDPYWPDRVCNGVALVPAGHEHIGLEWDGANDMEWVRKYAPLVIDDLFPDQVVSFKGHVKQNGLGDARIVYFHGEEKPHQLDLDWVQQHWNGGHEMADRNRYIISVEGKKAEGLGGWRDRQENAKRRTKKWNDPDRLAIAEARARAAAAAAGQPDPVPVAAKAAEAPQEAVEVIEATEAPEAADDLTAMSWDDLKAFYEEAIGEKVGHRMKRADVEAAIREALA
jgi:hypothetical protein